MIPSPNKKLVTSSSSDWKCGLKPAGFFQRATTPQESTITQKIPTKSKESPSPAWEEKKQPQKNGPRQVGETTRQTTNWPNLVGISTKKTNQRDYFTTIPTWTTIVFQPGRNFNLVHPTIHWQKRKDPQISCGFLFHWNLEVRQNRHSLANSHHQRGAAGFGGNSWVPFVPTRSWHQNIERLCIVYMYRWYIAYI